MLKDLYVMKVDAKQELDNMNEKKDNDRFKQLILVPEGISIDSLLDGDRYYLTGEKGAGKTALLIYTALKADELFNAEDKRRIDNISSFLPRRMMLRNLTASIVHSARPTVNDIRTEQKRSQIRV